MHPTAPFIHRQGEVDAWDNADFRAAVQATGKNQIILAGIVTEVCKFYLFFSSLNLDSNLTLTRYILPRSFPPRRRL
jgi:hypothetical protein